MEYALWAIAAAIVLLVVYDLTQTKHTILHNFPIIGHFRYWLERIGPELRQYIITSNTDERPFSRNERRWLYSSAKQENDMFGFGTDNNIEAEGHMIVKHSSFPLAAPGENTPGGWPDYWVPCAKTMGQAHNRPKAFMPQSIINISGMSYGALSGPAVEAMNRGAKIAGCLHNTGEGGISAFHNHGADLIYQIGTGYFGCRNEDGNFSLELLLELLSKFPQVKALEVKLSQGAKPGLGGTLPGVKVTKTIAEARGVPVGMTVKSPNHHTAFGNVDELIEFVELLASATGLPVGIKSAVGDMEFWKELSKKMAQMNQGPDFITVDGGEGGTGAAPLVYTDHVSLPFFVGFPRVYSAFAKEGLHEKIIFIGSGRLGLPYRAIQAMALGCDMINVGREAMMSIGCIQAQRCHTNHCPTGVATNNRWLVRGLEPTSKGARCANYILALRRELMSVSRTCGVIHPGLLGLDHLEIVRDHITALPAYASFHYEPDWGLPSDEDQKQIKVLMQSELVSKQEHDHPDANVS